VIFNFINCNAGAVRGCGWQEIGAIINLGSYYAVGIPSAIVLAFVLCIGGKVK
jgi:MATE family multidrug resistance protein